MTEDVETLLDDATDIAITTDIRTSRKTEGYLTLTAHFVTSSWELRNVVLNTIRIRKAHTGQNIQAEIQTLFEKWKIANKVSTLVTDNAANIVLAADLLRVRHLPCFAHTLNLIVKDSLKKSPEINEIIKKKIKAIVSYFHHSVKASDTLQDIQERLLSPQHKLIMEVETRWNSALYMLRRYTEQHRPVTTTLCLLSRNDLCVEEKDITLIKMTVEALEPFDQATTEMSSETEPTLSKVIPIVNMLHKSIHNLSSNKFPLVVQLQSELRKRFTNVQDTFFVAASTLLDPCFKRLPFAEGATAKTEARLKNNIKVHCQTEEQQTVEVTAVEQEMEPPTKQTCLWDSFDKEADDARKKAAPILIGPIIELRRYFEMPLMKRGEENPLRWWKKNEELFPGLSKEAKKLLEYQPPVYRLRGYFQRQGS